LLAVYIVFDCTYDSNGFLDVAESREILELAAIAYEERLLDTLTAISNPPLGNSWLASFIHPSAGTSVNLANLVLAEDEARVYVGARPLAGSPLGLASTGYQISYNSQDWLQVVTKRGQTDAPESSNWGGSVAFDPSASWSFDIDGPGAGESDLYSVAVHEFEHLLGVTFASDATWTSFIKPLPELTPDEQAAVNHQAGDYFTGPKTTALDGSPVPAHGAHFEDGVAMNGREADFGSSLASGASKPLTALDSAALDDIGWDVASSSPDSLAFYDAANGNRELGVSNTAEFALATWATIPPAAPWSDFLEADFNGDGGSDIFRWHETTGTLRLLESNGNSAFTDNAWVPSTPTRPGAMF